MCFLVYLNGAFDTPYGHKWIVWDPKEPSVMYPHNGCPNPVPNGSDILARKCLFDFSFQAEKVYHMYIYLYIRVYEYTRYTGSNRILQHSESIECCLFFTSFVLRVEPIYRLDLSNNIYLTSSIKR